MMGRNGKEVCRVYIEKDGVRVYPKDGENWLHSILIDKINEEHK